jgi:hypothetical protein
LSPLRSDGSRTVGQEAGPCERHPKALKTKLAQGGPSGLSSLRSDGPYDGQAVGWATLMAAKGDQNNSRKPRDLTETGLMTALKRVNLLFRRLK